MKQVFENKVVVITGASSGIGEACSRVFSKHGARVVLASRNEVKLRELSYELPDENLVVPTDVTCKEQCEALVQRVITRFGRIDVFICNAGISMRSNFIDCELEVLRKVMDTNFWGTVYCAKYALPYLLETKGSLVGVSSIAGFMGLPARTGYSASKYAINGFLEALRIEHLKYGLHVLSVCPGYTASNIRKLALDGKGRPQGESPRNESRMMTAGEVAEEVYQAIFHRKRTILLTGKGISAVWIHKFFPGMLDHILYREMKNEKNITLKRSGQMLEH